MKSPKAEPAMAESANPYQAPDTAIGRLCKVADYGSICGSPDEAMRFEHVRTESNLRALGLFLFLCSAWWMIGAEVKLSYLYLHLTGEILATWTAQPFHIARCILLPTLTLTGVVAGYGLRRLRGWSRYTGLFLAGLYAVYWLLICGWGLSQGEVAGTVAVCVAGTFVLIPFTLLLRPDVSTVISARYAEAREQTPYIKVRSRFPWWLIAGMITSIVVANLVVVFFVDPPSSR